MTAAGSPAAVFTTNFSLSSCCISVICRGGSCPPLLFPHEHLRVQRDVFSAERESGFCPERSFIGNMILSLRRESIQPAAGDLPCGPRTPWTAKGENGSDLLHPNHPPFSPLESPLAPCDPVGTAIGRPPSLHPTPCDPVGAATLSRETWVTPREETWVTVFGCGD